MGNCLFCDIVNGKVPSNKIYENDYVLAFLDISNDMEGHTLVIPKKHCLCFDECGAKYLAEVIKATQLIATHYLTLGYTGYNLIANSHESAGQSVNHFHMHIVPRKDNDCSRLDFSKKCPSKLKPETLAKKLKINQQIEEEGVQIYEGDDIVLYTDGACSGNPGEGGYCAILQSKGKEKIISGGETLTTNNKMELMAVIVGLEAIKKDKNIKVYSDSAYVVNAFEQGWLKKWKQNGYINSSGDNVANAQLWQRLDSLVSKKNVEFCKVKGHTDVLLNNKCDKIARQEAAKLKP